jgi:hypothetical protein
MRSFKIIYNFFEVNFRRMQNNKMTTVQKYLFSTQFDSNH